jgi:pilus assembly protein Flp/PilA
MLWNKIVRFVRDDEGLEMVEWAVVGSAIVITAALAFGPLGDAVASAMGQIAAYINPA